jgi:hypothetical protein
MVKGPTAPPAPEGHLEVVQAVFPVYPRASELGLQSRQIVPVFSVRPFDCQFGLPKGTTGLDGRCSFRLFGRTSPPSRKLHTLVGGGRKSTGDRKRILLGALRVAWRVQLLTPRQPAHSGTMGIARADYAWANGGRAGAAGGA